MSIPSQEMNHNNQLFIDAMAPLLLGRAQIMDVAI